MEMTPTELCNYRNRYLVPVHLVIIAVLLGEIADNGLDFRTALGRIDITRKKARSSMIDKIGDS